MRDEIQLAALLAMLVVCCTGFGYSLGNDSTPSNSNAPEPKLPLCGALPASVRYIQETVSPDDGYPPQTYFLLQTRALNCDDHGRCYPSEWTNTRDVWIALSDEDYHEWEQYKKAQLPRSGAHEERNDEE